MSKQITTTDDPVKRHALDLRKQIEHADYMALTSKRLEGQAMRPPKLSPFQRREARKRLAARESPRVIGRRYGVSRSTNERLA